MNLDTKCVHGAAKYTDAATGAVSFPIYQSATFMHPGVDDLNAYAYSRVQNPTREHLERTVAALEGGSDALAFTTGVAAEAMLMKLFSPGDHIVATEDLYGGTSRLFGHVYASYGLEFSYLDTGDLAALEAMIRPNTKAVFLETPSNPMMLVTDIAAVAELTKARDILLIVDNTFLTPYLQRPLSLGADVVVHSGTKYLGGHNDTMAGFLVVDEAELAERLRYLLKTTGAGLSPFDSWLILRGIKTLAVRMRQQEASAHQIAAWLREQPQIAQVNYCGFPDHPGYAISQRQADGFGAMLSFRVDEADTARRILSRLQLISYAESLGGVESLMNCPHVSTHAEVPEERKAALGIDDCLLRLSVGLEDADDLIADLAQALEVS
ncbi:MAG: PLP-dependent aspartate aminotransferase family protein [Oscillospiraceae bacterium]|nr:PLP-dependent aspartate aminotransferase family protein [Oscillospiraceae bacterium]